jgi:mannose-6-phosphate isomerase-like protein (cupin superfamily)
MGVFFVHLENETNKNTNYRKVIHTEVGMQLVLMSIPVNQDIGNEKHDTVDQFIRVEKGYGKAIIDNDKVYELLDGDSIIIPRGTWHRIVNSGNEPLQLYTIYSKANHPDGLVQKTKKEDTKGGCGCSSLISKENRSKQSTLNLRRYTQRKIDMY